MSLHFNQQVLFSFSHGTLDIDFLKSCIDKGYDINQILFDGDGHFDKDIFYFVTKSYHESLEELVSIINFLLDNGFRFQIKNCNHLYYFFLSISRLPIISHPSVISFICSFILKMQSFGLNISPRSVSYYYDQDLFEFILINSLKKTSFTKLSVSSIIFQLVTTLVFQNCFCNDDSSIVENAIIPKHQFGTLKLEWIFSLKKLFPIYDPSTKNYILRSLNSCDSWCL